MSNPIDQKVMSLPGASIKPPKPLLIEENMASKWKQWWRQFHWYATATELDSKPPQVQAATLLSCVGEDCIRVMDTFGLTDVQEKDMKVLKEKFDAYFVPKSCLTYERYVFGKIVQNSGEQFDSFLTRVREQAKKCAFSVLNDSMVKDRIISGTVHTKLIPQLLNDDFDLQKTIDICRNHEQSVKQSQVMLEKSCVEVNSLKQKKYQQQQGAVKEEMFWCNRCGLKHRKKECPAFNKVCLKCKRKGHFANRCFGSVGTSAGNNKYVRTVTCEEEEENSEELSVEELFIGAVDDDDNNDDVWYEKVQINGKSVTLKLDSGAACNVLPYSIFRTLGEKLMDSTTKRLVSYSNHKLNVKGEAVLPVIVKGRSESAVFKVVDGDVTPILGQNVCPLQTHCQSGSADHG